MAEQANKNKYYCRTSGGKRIYDTRLLKPSTGRGARRHTQHTRGTSKNGVVVIDPTPEQIENMGLSLSTVEERPAVFPKWAFRGKTRRVGDKVFVDESMLIIETVNQ